MRALITTTAVAAALTALPAALAPAPSLAATATARDGDCAAGELCLWEKTGFRGARHTHELAGTDIESCVPLPRGVTAASLANRTGRPVTTYQSAECAETGEFDTYPSGSWAPEPPYRIRAFKIWES
ncbi:peptidase inhibitor family I36 protein [Streptomyces sp. NPDC018031]|uniref:peptidase inhibitor family I36 protein n=1 Tax=Streptomyces sp. NPDC018031 TaxID=3365033 RepID=UPI0037A47812